MKSGRVPKAKQIPEKCRKCALLSAGDARAKHPDCWDDKLCHARRFYARNRDRVNQKRAKKRIEREHQIPVPEVNYGVLQVWREMREDSPIHALGAEVWDGKERIAIVQPVHCAGWLPSQVHEYVGRVLVVLEGEYGFRKFAHSRLISPSQCPIHPCPLCSE